MEQKTMKELEKKAKEIRKDILTMTTLAGSGHPGGSLSATDIVVALYFHKMRHDPKNPDGPDRDRFVLSKGHAAPLLYACLARSGYFPVEELKTLRRINSRLQGHPCRTELPGIEVSSGSLGQGLSVANGIALAGKIDKKDYKIYVLLGDGEVQEGQVWEAAMTAAHYKLDNVTAIVDCNNLQIDGNVSDVKGIQPIADKWKAFGWNVIEINGHNFDEIAKALDSESRGKPKAIIANTIKGKAVSFMEGKCQYHGKTLSQDECDKALKELCD